MGAVYCTHVHYELVPGCIDNSRWASTRRGDDQQGGLATANLILSDKGYLIECMPFQFVCELTALGWRASSFLAPGHVHVTNAANKHATYHWMRNVLLEGAVLISDAGNGGRESKVLETWREVPFAVCWLAR